MFSTIPAHLKFKPPNLSKTSAHNRTPLEVLSAKKLTKNSSFQHHHVFGGVRDTSSNFFVSIRACGDGGQGEIFAAKTQSSATDVKTVGGSLSSSNDSYVSLFVRMIGLDNDRLDREQAVVALWKYSLGGKHCVDNIMKYDGSVNLVVNLLKSDSESACEAAAGLLRVLSSVNLYRDFVARSGAIEELTGLLTRPSLSSGVKEQTICTLWNLSVDEKLSVRIACSEVLPLLVKYLEDDNMKVKEAAGGVLANLALSQSNHKIMVGAGVIPELAKVLTADVEESKVARKVAKNALLEFAKDEYNRILIMEEGLLLVPLIGSAAYKSFQPSLYSWPSLPDGTEIEQSPKVPSRYGASKLLLGLNIDDEKVDLEEAKTNAVIGRTQQQFLARIGAIEIEDDSKSDGGGSSGKGFTILPWVDGVARLVLILGLEDESAIARAAESIADASINEHIRVSFKEAGALKLLGQLINHSSEIVRLAVIRALDRLSISNNVCQTIEAEGHLHFLASLLKRSKSESSLTSMIINILSRTLDPNKETKLKFYNERINGSKEELANGTDMTSSAGELVDMAFVARLVDILKKPNPDLQRKAASILEYIVSVQGSIEKLISAGIESGLEEVFRQKSLTEMEPDIELPILELEEAGLAVSTASRLLSKLLDHPHFYPTVNPDHFTNLLRPILTSPIPLRHKHWAAACLVKLRPPSGQAPQEVTLHETIPRLVELIDSSFSDRAVEEAISELSQVVAEGGPEAALAATSHGGIFAAVKAMGSSGERAVGPALDLLCGLSEDGENHAAIVAAGAVPVLKKLVLGRGPHSMAALQLLRTLPT